MSDDEQAGGILIALCITGIFFALSIADWIDGKAMAWEREAAERHAAVYATVRYER